MVALREDLPACSTRQHLGNDRSAPGTIFNSTKSVFTHSGKNVFSPSEAGTTDSPCGREQLDDNCKPR